MNYHTAWQQIVTFSLIFYPTYWNQNNDTLMLHWGMSTCDWDEMVSINQRVVFTSSHLICGGFQVSQGNFYFLITPGRVV